MRDIRRPVRVTRNFTQKLDGAPDEVLPLLCPVREVEWVPGWLPRLVLSASGVAERDCVFITPDTAAGAGAEAIWTILSHDPDAGTVEMLKVTPGFLVVRLAITLRAREGASYAEVSYQYTALSTAGEAYVRERSEEALNRHLRSGLSGYHPPTWGGAHGARRDGNPVLVDQHV